jgi:mono/diheme cytochrome c family protein
LTRQPRRARRSLALALVHGLVVFALVVLLPQTGSAQDTETNDPDAETDVGEPTAEDVARDEQLREGETVYTTSCSSCHQPAGIGLSGQFPPLAGNPRIDDSAYVEEVITNGQSGELVVGGVTYDGVMPSLSTLSDDDTAAVIAFIQAGFQAPLDTAAVGATGPEAGTELPGVAKAGLLIAGLLAFFVVLLVLSPRIIGVNDRLHMPRLDAWLKTAVIVVGVIFLTVVLPDWALKTSTVSGWSRFAQDAVGVGVWITGLGIVLWVLWYAHKESRV